MSLRLGAALELPLSDEHREAGYKVGLIGGMCICPSGLNRAEFASWARGHVRGVFARRKAERDQYVSLRVWV